MKDNCKRYGFIQTIDELYNQLKNDLLDRPSMREWLPNQEHTRNAIGLFNILDNVEGFGNSEVFMAYFPLLYELNMILKKEYGYTALEYKSLIIVKLLANKEISEHMDEDGMYKYAHRIHIPIVTNEGCIFTIGGEKIRMAAGEMVEINNTIPHSVVNGDTNRIHLIVDIIGIKEHYDIDALNTPLPKSFYLEEN